MSNDKTSKIPLVVCIVIIVVLAVTNVYAFSYLLTEKLESLGLQDTNENLREDIRDLRKASLKMFDTYWQDNHPLLGSEYVNVYGIVVNTGVETATNVMLTIEVYGGGVLLKTESFPFSDIYGKGFEKFDVDVTYSGDANNVEISFTYE